MRYVDGFVAVLKKGRLAEYKKMASEAGKIWKKHGALDYVESIGDDLNPNTYGMHPLNFPRMTKLKKGEKVIFSFITYKSKKHRDAVNKKVMKEMEKHNEWKNMPMPFDMKRFAYGGFRSIVDL